MRIAIFICLLLIVAPALATDDGFHLELSFGQSQMYLTESGKEFLLKQQNLVLPTSAILVLGEYLLNDRFGVPLFINIPTGEARYFENGELKTRTASTIYSLGVRWSPLVREVFKNSRMDLQTGLCLGAAWPREPSSWRPAPIATGRIHIWQKDGFTMYCGLAYAFVINSTTLYYGVGHRF